MPKKKRKNISQSKFRKHYINVKTSKLAGDDDDWQHMHRGEEIQDCQEFTYQLSECSTTNGQVDGEMCTASCQTSEADLLESHTDLSVKDDYLVMRDELSNKLRAPFILDIHHEEIHLVQFYQSEYKSVIKISVFIHKDFSSSILVHQKELPKNHYLWDGLPLKFDTVEMVLKLLEKISKYSVCIGSPEAEFQDLVPVGAGIVDNGREHEGVQAYREGDFCATQGNLSYHSTIRSVHCSMLVPGARCGHCSTYRRLLRQRRLRMREREARTQDKENTNLLHSFHNHSKMSFGMLSTKLKQQKQKIRSLQNEVDTLKRKFDKEILQNGISFNNIQDIELKDLMSSCQTDMEAAYSDPNSLQRLFWDQQKKFVSSGKNGMRWHPMIIRWCLYLRHRSSKAYDAMRESGFINLPSARTLFDYSHYTKSAIGYTTDVVKVLKEEAAKRGMDSVSEEWKSFVGLLFDELKIKEDLVYDKHTGELIGYCDLDSIGNCFMDLEKTLSANKNKTNEMAKYVLVVMVRGITSDLKFPLAAFATKSITADFLYPIIWKAVHILENINLKVLFLTCDGASANRRFFKLHTANGHDFVHFTDNPYDTTRKIYFISDVPHLLKTTRNCFSNSFSHKKTRTLWKNGKNISWMHIVRLYEEHCETNIYTPCPELSRSHIDLTAYSCMKVRLAAQVMSESVANALEELYDDQVSETVQFIRNVNKFFDCLNVRNLFEGRNKRNPDLAPYKTSNDERLDWLRNDFLDYLDSWKEEVHRRPGNLRPSERASMLLSYQTMDGLKISVNSITECVKFMLNSGSRFILTHAFNQDPLEEHFSHYRHKGGACDNPTVYDVRNTLTQIRAVKTQALTPKRANVLREVNSNHNVDIDYSPLPRRQVDRK